MLIGSTKARATTLSEPMRSARWLDMFEELLVKSAGQIVTLCLAGHQETGVFHVPLGLVWTLSETCHTLTDVISPSESEDHLHLERDGVILQHQPEALNREV